MRMLIAMLILILIMLQVRLWTGPGSYAHIMQLNEDIAVQTIENGNLKERNGLVYAEVNELKTGMDAVEERARSELGLIKKGETFYLIIE